MNAKTLALLLLMGAPLAGCGDHERDHQSIDPDPTRADSTLDAIASTVDANAELVAPIAGEETAVYIEHLQDPSTAEWYWRVTASCDTTISGEPCWWDVYATPPVDDADAEVVGMDTESDDTVGWYENGYTAMLLSDTDYDLDGFALYTDPGATVEFEVYLDWEIYGDPSLGQRYVYWIGDGAVHAGSPSPILDLTPVGY